MLAGVYSDDMSEQADVVDELSEVGVLAGVRWAYVSATSRTLEMYSEADGHDAAWLGNTRFTYFRDRLDRVFACERYAVPPQGDGADLDQLYAELSAQEISLMPRVNAGVVVRSNLNGSPGWACGSRRLLLASGVFGKLDQMPWPQKSPTKQRVARQPNPEPAQPSLFEGFAEEELGGLEFALRTANETDMTTLVLAHALDAMSQQKELVIGRPRLNSGGGRAWHWRHDVLSAPPTDGGRRLDDARRPTGPGSVPDAPVRIRRRGEQADGRAGGDQ